MASDKVTIERLKRLMDVKRDLSEKLHEVDDEMYRILHGEEGIADKVRRLEEHFATHWSALYNGTYQWSYKITRKQWKDLLKGIPEDELALRVTTFFRKIEDPFFVKCKHGFSAFVSTINQHASEARTVNGTPLSLTLEAPAPRDCKHLPRCRSDREHTERRERDMRTVAS